MTNITPQTLDKRRRVWEGYNTGSGKVSRYHLRQENQEMEPTENTIRQQFAQDYTLVVDNDRTAHRAMEVLLNQQGAHNVPWLSEKLRESFENSISEVVERERRRGNQTTADLISQMLIGYGSAPFDDIARHYIDADLERRAYDRFTSRLKTEAIK